VPVTEYEALLLPPTPPPSSAVRRDVLRRVRRRDTAPELALRRELHRLGLRFLVDVAPAGTNRRRRVDVVLRGARVAVLVHGCFWHGCPEHFHAPKANGEWWRLKLASVQRRDADTLVQLGAPGWLPVVVWEHEDMPAAAQSILVLERHRRAGAPRRPQGERDPPTTV
jgi:DNA mismatch endonuclease (patch repair protein)